MGVLLQVDEADDPVAEGVAQSFARPGGNVTGLTLRSVLRSLRKAAGTAEVAAGRIVRVAVRWDLDLEIFRRFWTTPLADAARLLGLELQEPVRVTDAQGLPAAFGLIKQQRVLTTKTAARALSPPR